MNNIERKLPLHSLEEDFYLFGPPNIITEQLSPRGFSLDDGFGYAYHSQFVLRVSRRVTIPICALDKPQPYEFIVGEDSFRDFLLLHPELIPADELEGDNSRNWPFDDLRYLEIQSETLHGEGLSRFNLKKYEHNYVDHLYPATRRVLRRLKVLLTFTQQDLSYESIADETALRWWLSFSPFYLIGSNGRASGRLSLPVPHDLAKLETIKARFTLANS